jgi:hypothetical protein
MGRCGCMETIGDFRFPGPKGGWYTLTIYTGCRYCDEGPGVNLSFYGKDSPLYEEVLFLPELPIGEILGVPTLDWTVLSKSIETDFKGLEAEAVVDELPDYIEAAAQAVRKRWLKVWTEQNKK